MVAVTRDSRFYVRGSAGKHPLTTAEIRSAFQLSAELPERIRRFRDERLGRIASGETPVPLFNFGKVVVHMVPVEALMGERAPAAIAAWAAEPHKLQPFESASGWNHRFNFDGFVTHSGPGEGAQWSYLQILRNGAVEASTALLGRDQQGFAYLNAWGIEEETVKGVRRLLPLYQQHGTNVPIAILITLLGVRGSRLPPSGGRMLRDRSIERDDLLLPDVLVETFDVDLPTLLRPTFDALWQSLGVPRSLCYDENGKWDAAGFRW